MQNDKVTGKIDFSPNYNYQLSWLCWLYPLQKTHENYQNKESDKPGKNQEWINNPEKKIATRNRWEAFEAFMYSCHLWM